ncbi:hypothetical protein GUJ93_ZPchr0012g20840 [Zizania palustris]|uniref:Uncharacterized protein n=1 Tax=Zizania palustris TaxID=103762 RepID=A0A8J6BRX1_ZIZPA|nr:hypothetical protein GUJ93_ZPchr0012g20840 [Zizania palustris]
MPPATTAAAFSKPARLMESFVPFRDILCDNYEPNILHSSQQIHVHRPCGLPALLHNGSMMGTNNGFEAVKVRDDRMVLNSKIMNLQKKWNEYCLRLAPRSPEDQQRSLQAISTLYWCSRLPADKEKTANPSKDSKAFENLVQYLLHIPTQLQDRGVQCQHGNLSNLDRNDRHASPSSAAPVATDLVLGTPHESSSKGSSYACCKHVDDSESSIHLAPKMVGDLNLKHPQLSDWGDSNFRGKTVTDCIVEQLIKKHNIDRADCLVQDSLSDAIETGRLHGNLETCKAFSTLKEQLATTTTTTTTGQCYARDLDPNPVRHRACMFLIIYYASRR